MKTIKFHKILNIKIRQKFEDEYLFMQKPSFLIDITSISEFELYKRKNIPKNLNFFFRKNRLDNEHLLNFALFFCIRFSKKTIRELSIFYI